MSFRQLHINKAGQLCYEYYQDYIILDEGSDALFGIDVTTMEPGKVYCSRLNRPIKWSKWEEVQRQMIRPRKKAIYPWGGPKTSDEDLLTKYKYHLGYYREMLGDCNRVVLERGYTNTSNLEVITRAGRYQISKDHDGKCCELDLYLAEARKYANNINIFTRNLWARGYLNHNGKWVKAQGRHNKLLIKELLRANKDEARAEKQ